MRTGKLQGQTKVMIPWEDDQGNRQWQVMSFTGDIYASKMYSEIRKYVKDAFGVDVDRDWLEHVPRIANLHDTEIKMLTGRVDEMVEEWIKRLEYNDADENNADSGSEDCSTETPAGPLCTVQN